MLVTDQNINTSDISSDGQVLLFLRADPKTLRDLWALPLERGKMPYPLMQTPAQDLNGQLAPNGRWMAYQSNESGRHEVGLRMFTGGGRVIQVSADGGTQPRWRSDGRELFYLDLDGRLMAVPITFSSDATVVTVGLRVGAFRHPYRGLEYASVRVRGITRRSTVPSRYSRSRRCASHSCHPELAAISLNA